MDPKNRKNPVYPNDDHSRFAGPDYREIKVRDEEIQPVTQRNFTGYGPKNYTRSDVRIYEEVCETLMKHPQVDASKTGVEVEGGIVSLLGFIESREAKRLAEALVEDLPGVLEVRNLLKIG